MVLAVFHPVLLVRLAATAPEWVFPWRLPLVTRPKALDKATLARTAALA